MLRMCIGEAFASACTCIILQGCMVQSCSGCLSSCTAAVHQDMLKSMLRCVCIISALCSSKCTMLLGDQVHVASLVAIIIAAYTILSKETIVRMIGSETSQCRHLYFVSGSRFYFVLNPPYLRSCVLASVVLHLHDTQSSARLPAAGFETSSW